MSRVSLEFYFYKTMGSLDVFADLWCCENAICSVFGNDFVFDFNFFVCFFGVLFSLI